MGEHEGWAQPPSGLLPNGLLPNEAASVIQALDSERWSKAEQRTAELIACIQPNQPSEERRNAVADYVQRLIMRCFPCQVGVMLWRLWIIYCSRSFDLLLVHCFSDAYECAMICICIVIVIVEGC